MKYEFIDGRPHVQCIRCGQPTPAWDADERRIRLGLIIRVPNPHFDHIHPELLHRPGDRRTQSTTRLNNETRDTRTSTYRPVLRVGPGCEACWEVFTTLIRDHGPRAHFRVKTMDELSQFLPR